MKVIEIAEPLNQRVLPQEDVVLALGFFDGVHQGHQAVIKKAKQIAVQKHLKLAVMTFDRYPKIYFQKIDPEKISYVTTLHQRLEKFADLAVDIAYVAKFDRNLAMQSPQSFVDKFMVGLHAKVVVAGFDYTFGKKEIANMDTLPKFAKGRFEVVKVSKQVMQNQKIGTTQIKQLLNKGEIKQVNQRLGYPFAFYGKVVHGKARGRTLGFPTLNIQPEKQQQLPGIGVYAVKVQVDQHWYQGMASVSHNETFGNNPLTVEINLFDFNQMIYGKEVKVEWDKFLRPSIKFNSAEQLIDQLKQDKIVTKQYFLKKNKN